MVDQTQPLAPAKPITAAAPQPLTTKAIGTEPAPAAQKKVGDADDDLVEVKQLVPYLGLEDKRINDGKPYMVTRRRAAELRANGLAEYTNAADHGREVDDAVKQAGETARAKFQTKKG